VVLHELAHVLDSVMAESGAMPCGAGYGSCAAVPGDGPLRPKRCRQAAAALATLTPDEPGRAAVTLLARP